MYIIAYVCASATISLDTVKLSLLFFVQHINYIKQKVLLIVNNVRCCDLQDRLPNRDKQSCMSSSSNGMIEPAIQIRRILYYPLIIHHTNFCSLLISNFEVKADFMPTIEKKPQACHTIRRSIGGACITHDFIYCS